jgi:hypothetical protein
VTTVRSRAHSQSATGSQSQCAAVSTDLHRPTTESQPGPPIPAGTLAPSAHYQREERRPSRPGEDPTTTVGSDQGLRFTIRIAPVGCQALRRNARDIGHAKGNGLLASGVSQTFRQGVALRVGKDGWVSRQQKPSRQVPVDEQIQVVLAVLKGELSLAEAARRQGCPRRGWATGGPAA